MRENTTQRETQVRLPEIFSKLSNTCCHVVAWLRLMVLRPAAVMADTTRNRLSTYPMLRVGSEEP